MLDGRFGETIDEGEAGDSGSADESNDTREPPIEIREAREAVNSKT